MKYTVSSLVMLSLLTAIHFKSRCFAGHDQIFELLYFLLFYVSPLLLVVGQVQCTHTYMSTVSKQGNHCCKYGSGGCYTLVTERSLPELVSNEARALCVCVS
jgi:hypothetical protein